MKCGCVVKDGNTHRCADTEKLIEDIKILGTDAEKIDKILEHIGLKNG